MTPAPYATKFLEGVEHFNALEFWHAHESWEELWLEAETDVEQFLQGMIQLAAAYHHLKRGTYRGGVRLFDAALRRLEAFPRDFSGIDRTAAEEAARKHRLLFSGENPEERLHESQYPKLLRTSSEMPPRDPW
jgi:predicted metal-dependent hydrolase